MAESPGAEESDAKQKVINASSIIQWQNIQVQHDEMLTRTNIPETHEQCKIKNPGRYIVTTIKKRYRNIEGLLHIYCTNDEIVYITNENQVQRSIQEFIGEMIEKMQDAPQIEKRLYITHVDMLSKSQLQELINQILGEVTYIKMFSSLPHASDEYGHAAIVAVMVDETRCIPTQITYNDDWKIEIALARNKSQYRSDSDQSDDEGFRPVRSPQKNNREARVNSRKPRACWHYKTGDPNSCRYGNRCKFSHDTPADAKQENALTKILFVEEKLTRPAETQQGNNVNENPALKNPDLQLQNIPAALHVEIDDNSEDNQVKKDEKRRQIMDRELEDYAAQHPNKSVLATLTSGIKKILGTKRKSKSSPTQRRMEPTSLSNSQTYGDEADFDEDEIQCVSEKMIETPAATSALGQKQQ